jgi:hypothetical protein
LSAVYHSPCGVGGDRTAYSEDLEFVLRSSWGHHGSENEASFLVRHRSRRNSILVVEKPEAEAQDLI